MTLEHDFEQMRALSITSYRSTQTHFVLDSDKRPQPLATVDVIQNDDQFSQELQLMSAGNGPFNWTTGAYFFKAQSSYDPIHVILNGGVVVITIPAE